MRRYEGKYTIFEPTPSGLNIIRKSSGQCFSIVTEDFVQFVKQTIKDSASELLGSAINKLKF